MNAEILCVGTELLLGDVVNTNAAEIAKELARLGINVYHHEVVGDNPKRLKESLARAFETCDLVVLTGGLGPTYDDLTKETVASYFKKELVMNEEYLLQMTEFFKTRGSKMTDNNKKQAMLPEGSIMLENPRGTAPGCIIEGDGKVAIMMPGPPREMLPMLNGPVKDYLTKKSDSVLVSKVLNFFGIGESALEQRIKETMIESTNPTIAPYAKTCECHLRLTARAKTEEEARLLIEPVVKELYQEFKKGEIYGEDYAEISEAAVKVLTQNGHTLGGAESCTGGMLSSKIVDHAGASKMFLGTIVSYSNEVKQSVLGVSSETLSTHGAVSHECAIEMARGARRVMGSDIGVAITGVASPSSSTDKPVGTVFIAVCSEHAENVDALSLAGGRQDDRELIRTRAACHALKMVIDMSRSLNAN